MNTEDAIDKLEEALDLIVEAQYTIEEILPQINILGTKNQKLLEPVTDIIKILSQLSQKFKVNAEIPIEGMYKLLYSDYKKVCQEKKDLQRDVVKLMKEKKWDNDTAMLNMKLMRAEREIEKLTNSLAVKEERIHDLKSQKKTLKSKLKELGYKTKEEYDEEE